MIEQLLLNKLLAAFETFTGFFTVIQSDHRYIHSGLAHTAIIDTGSISTTYNIGFTTPSTESGKYIHWRPIGMQSSSNYVTYKLFEGDSFSAGTAITTLNRNRNLNATRPSVMQDFKKGVTATPVGTLIQLTGVGAEGGPTTRSGGSGAGADRELVLLPDTDYVIQLTPAGTTSITLELYWYEE